MEHLVLGELHKADNLRQMALRLFVKNMDLIVDSDVYKTLKIKYPNLALESQKLWFRWQAPKEREMKNVTLNSSTAVELCS